MTDRGHAVVEFALAVGLLLLPVALVVMAFGPWSERRVEAEAVAAEGTRAAVLALSQGAGQARIASDTAGLGIDPSLVRVGWCGSATAALSESVAGVCSLSRGSVVSVTVELWTPFVATPWGAVGGLWVSAGHSEPIDLYRSLD